MKAIRLLTTGLAAASVTAALLGTTTVLHAAPSAWSVLDAPDLRFVSVYNGSRMAAYGDDTNDTVATAERGEKQYATEHWRLDQLGPGTYALHNLGGDRCLQPESGRVEGGAKLALRECNEEEIQQWHLAWDPTGEAVVITPVDNPGLAVTIDNPGHQQYSDLYLHRESLPSADRSWMMVPA